jgi:hypothetical protein
MTGDACQAPSSRLQERSSRRARVRGVTAEDARTLAPAIPSSESDTCRVRTPGHTPCRSAVCTRHPAARLPEGSRSARQELETVSSTSCQTVGSSARVSRRLALHQPGRTLAPMRASRSRRAAGSPSSSSTTGPLRCRHRRKARHLGARDPRVARQLPASKVGRWRCPCPVPYRLDTPPPRTVARSLISGLCPDLHALAVPGASA